MSFLSGRTFTVVEAGLALNITSSFVNGLILPSKFREVGKDHGVDRYFLTRGLDRCIFMFSEAEWRLQEHKFKNMSFTKKETRSLNRMFFAVILTTVSMTTVNLTTQLTRWLRTKAAQPQKWLNLMPGSGLAACQLLTAQSEEA